ncbi:MAG: ring-cleaving dioxygenase [Bryobacteraceae bacterium]
MKTLNGVHHVTAITNDAQRNVDFYTGLLGLRLVKKTVNFDDPQSYHLYYGDARGTPGTILTFFVWPGASKGRVGPGEPSKVAFEVPAGSLSSWRQRLANSGVPITENGNVFGAATISFPDPDGMQLELVESSVSRNTEIWTTAEVDKDKSIRTIAGVTLTRASKASSDELYTKHLGFRETGADGGRRRFTTGDGSASGFIDVVEPEKTGFGRMGAGTIHHLAFRTPDDATQLEWLQKIDSLGLQVSPLMDRNYFHSIYFREPSGILFEIATDGPGFAVDEPAETLGEALKLPAQYERARNQLEAILPPIHVAGQAANSRTGGARA